MLISNSAALNFIRSPRHLLQTSSVQMYEFSPAMASNEIHNFMYKFHEIWSHGRRARMNITCEEGYAWVTLSTDLGPWRLPPRSRPTPRPPRPTRTTTSPQSPGNPPPP